MWNARHSQLYMIINFHIFFGKFSEKQYAKLSEPWENDENFAQALWNNANGYSSKCCVFCYRGDCLTAL